MPLRGGGFKPFLRPVEVLKDLILDLTAKESEARVKADLELSGRIDTIESDIGTTSPASTTSEGVVYLATGLDDERETAVTTASAVKAALNDKQDNLEFDATPTKDSENPVTSGGVYTALDDKQDNLEFDTAPTKDSENPVTSGGVYKAINDVLSAALAFKGTVATKDELDAITGMMNGDVYIVTRTGIVYAYVETDKAWKELSNTVIDTSKFVTAESLKEKEYDLTTVGGIHEALAAVIPVLGGKVKLA